MSERKYILLPFTETGLLAKYINQQSIVSEVTAFCANRNKKLYASCLNILAIYLQNTRATEVEVVAAALEDMEEMCRISRFRHLIFRTLSPHIRATAIVQEAGVQVAGTVDHQVVSDFSLARMQKFPSYIFIINIANAN